MNDKGFAKIQIMTIIGLILSTVLSISILGFIGWVIIKTMQHFGII